MLEGHRREDRGPLFPGNSCFPLSPDSRHTTDYRYHTRGQRDQLNMIFNLLGTPTEAEQNMLEREDARRYIRCFAAREGEGFQAKFPHATGWSLDMLRRLLTFSPERRMTVVEALRHPLLADIREAAKETTA